MPAPDALLALVERFQHNRDHYHRPDYNETQVRREFIAPFFISLGWDVENRQGLAPRYQEVIHEASVRVGGAVQSPDYCFRVGAERKFFVEAKKPAVNIRAGVLERQIAAADREIDRLVYALYGLTAGEIALVEGAA